MSSSFVNLVSVEQFTMVARSCSLVWVGRAKRHKRAFVSRTLADLSVSDHLLGRADPVSRSYILNDHLTDWVCVSRSNLS